MESLVAWSQMLELLTEISIEKRFYNCYIIDQTNIRFLWSWWSKQLKVTTKYKMQTTPHFTLICQSGEDIIIQKCRASRFCCTCLVGRVAVETIVEASIFETWVLCQSECACLYQTVIVVVIFTKNIENTYPKGRALMQMYRVVPQTKRGN